MKQIQLVSRVGQLHSTPNTRRGREKTLPVHENDCDFVELFLRPFPSTSH